MLKIGHPEDEKKETGQYNTQGTCNKAVEEEPFSMRLLLDHFMLKFGHREDEKKETGQYKTQEICNEAVEEDPSSLRFIPDHFKTRNV